MRDRYRKIIVACGVVTLLSLGASAVATAQTYTITDVGTAGGIGDISGNDSSITAINNLGQVVVNNVGIGHAFLWQGGVMTDLDSLGGGFSLASGINDAGQVVGMSTRFSTGGIQAFLWQNGKMTDLDVVGLESEAFGINAAGQVVGLAVFAISDGFAHAALWRNGQMTDLGSLLPGPCCISSEALSINDAGQVVGWTRIANVNQDRHAFLWQNGVMTDLGTLGGVGDFANFNVGSMAFGINTAGQVVGMAVTANGEGHAALWQKDSQGVYSITDLDPRSLAAESRALGINAAGQIVGNSGNLDGLPQATMWQKDLQGAYTVITDLNTLLPPGSGWNLVTARAINDRGQIIGTAIFNGVDHMYLLSPVELLDPVPELLSGPAVTTDKELLARKGRIVKGVAADGVAQLVIRIPAQAVGEQFVLTVLNAQQVQSSSQDEDGAVADVFNQSFRSSATVTAQNTAKGPMAFALYLAPRDFARICNSSPCPGDVFKKSREVTLQLQAGNTIPIKIVRPPVVLIHGIWSEQSSWDDFQLATDARFKIFRADYKETNGESIQINTYNVEADLDIDLREFKSDSKVAAVQFDIVTHSMGGLLARNLATLNSYRRVTNYRAGDIHKLITLDTPHLGSQFANRLGAASPFCRLVINRKLKIGGAVKDLEYGSPAIAKLLEPTTPIKARLIAGQATLLQEVESATAFTLVSRVLALGLCSSLLPKGGFAEVFSTPQDPEGHSDLIVSVISQLGKTIAVGRQDPPADAPYIGIEHLRALPLFLGPTPHDDPSIGQRVIDLLNTSVATPDFGDILP